MNKIRSALVAAAAGLAVAGGAQAAPTVGIGFTNGVQHNASGISENAVSSAAMAGMSVQMCFFGAACETTAWGTGDIGASGQGWTFAAGIDTFSTNWVLSVSGGALQSFTLYGFDALVVFDTVLDPNFLLGSVSPNSSPGSGNGRPFTLESGPTNVVNYAVRYFDRVSLAGVNFNDLYLGMRVDFNMVSGNGFSGELEFKADTDKVPLGGTLIQTAPPGPNPVPEPGTLALVALSLGLLAARRRRS